MPTALTAIAGAETTNAAAGTSQSHQLTTNEERLSDALEGKNVEINFWGKVVDQDGNALSDARIKSHIRSWATLQDGLSSYPQLIATSDERGRFEFRNAKGDLLVIEALEKSGYEAEPGALRGFGFNTSKQFRSSPDSPVVFRMWMTNIHEQLLTGRRSFHVTPDGRTYSINLEGGTILESGGGDLQVSLKYATEPVAGQAYDWVAELSVVNGGLIEEEDNHSSMYAAPATGYSSTFRYAQQIKGGQEGSTGKKRFYLRMANGQRYGRLSAEIFGPYNERIPGLVRIEYAVNPSGSRVLR